MALKLTKTAGNLDTGADCIEKNAEGKLPFRPVELTKRGHQTMRITEKNAKRTRHSSRSTSTTKGTTETIDGNDGIVGYYDHEIIDDSPCSFTDDGVTVLKEIISYFDDSSASVSDQEVFSSTIMDNIPLGCLADDYNLNNECNGVYFPDKLSPVSLNLSEKTNLGIGLPDIACGNKDSSKEEDQNDNMFNSSSV